MTSQIDVLRKSRPPDVKLRFMAAILNFAFGARNPHPHIYHCIIKDKTISAKSRSPLAFQTIKHVRVVNKPYS